MTKLIIASFILFLSFNLSFGQSFQLKLIEKEKYSKAEKLINKSLAKKPDDIELNYTKARLLIKQNYKGYNTHDAYYFINKSIFQFQSLNDEKEIKSLNKIPINDHILQLYSDTICRLALNDVIAKDEISSYENYLEYYKTASSGLISKCIEYRNSKAFNIACDLNTVESYDFFIQKYSHSLQYDDAIKRRDLVAFNNACNSNTVDSFQSFIDTYPNAIQKSEAILKRDSLEFEIVKKSDDINSYKQFVQKYPEAVDVALAWDYIHQYEFNQALKINTTQKFQEFITKYPNSKQYPEALKILEEKQYSENVDVKNWHTYMDFIEEFPTNSWRKIAIDSLSNMATKLKNASVFEFIVNHTSGFERKEAILTLHDMYAIDGEKQTLDQFYSKYDDAFLAELKEKDYELVYLGNELNLLAPYDSSDYDLYDEYIRLAAPREKAFVALQRMISKSIDNKDWDAALEKLEYYLEYWGNLNKKVKDLIEMVKSKWDDSITINSVGSNINTVSGGEYVPVISADDKLLYFCGRDRDDNIGGEDIFVSKYKDGSWSKSELVSDLSNSSIHDAPESLSSDGTKFLIFKSGKLYYSEKSSTGWDEAIKFPETINSSSWQADAMISSDGKALIFSSVKSGGYNFVNTNNPYHGDNAYPSDIYVSILDENNNWGTPINLGPTINTPFGDRSPFLHPDMKTLFFSSDGHGGLGKLDVFKSTRLADSCWDCWSEPINLGKEINTSESDWGYTISTNGEKAYFSKMLKNNSYDIYWINLPKHLRPELVATISGKITNRENQPVSAEIRWEDLETGKSIGQSKSDPTNGNFFIVLPLNKIYGYYVNKEGYYPISNNIDLRKIDKTIDIEENIILISYKQMADEGITVPINNLFFDFAKSELLPYSLPELRRVASIIKSNNLTVEIGGHTDNVGDDKKNQLLSEQRAQAVKDFLINEGCQADLFKITGYGETKPLATNDDDKGRAKNRRVELKLIK
jgi:outer membrane protein OmpA-like peptidoglycan-associated protein